MTYSEINKKKLKKNRVIAKFEEDAEPLPSVKVKSKKVAGLNKMLSWANDSLKEAKNEFKGVLDRENK